MRLCKIPVLALLAAALLAGCQAAGPDTPEAVFEAFDTAMRAQDYDAALELIAFEPWARQQNPDWDTFPPSQRNLIVDKLRDDLRGGLAAMAWPAGGMTLETTSTSADATRLVAAQGRQHRVALDLQPVDGAWRIVGGLPGMAMQPGLDNLPLPAEGE